MEGTRKRLPSKGIDVVGVEDIPLEDLPLDQVNLSQSSPVEAIITKRPKLVLSEPTKLLSISAEFTEQSFTEQRSMLPLSLQSDGMHDATADLNVTANGLDNFSDTDVILGKSVLDLEDAMDNGDFLEGITTEINCSPLKICYDSVEGHTCFPVAFSPPQMNRLSTYQPTCLRGRKV